MRLSVSFYDLASALADPTAVTVKYRDPATMAITSVAVPGGGGVKDATGLYHYDLSLTKKGDWYFRWEGTGTVAAAGESYVSAAPTVFS